MPAAENSKELRAPEPAADPGECGTANDTQIAGNDGKADTAPAVPVAAPIADGVCFAVSVFPIIPPFFFVLGDTESLLVRKKVDFFLGAFWF